MLMFEYTNKVKILYGCHEVGRMKEKEKGK